MFRSKNTIGNKAHSLKEPRMSLQERRAMLAESQELRKSLEAATSIARHLKTDTEKPTHKAASRM